MNPNEKEYSHSNRWWEFYFVRYAIGTVLGAILIYALFSVDSGNTSANTFFPKEIANLTSGHIATLFAFGFLFCYLSSAPILVFHAARFSIYPTPPLSIERLSWSLFIPALLGAIAFLCKFSIIESLSVFLGTSVLTTQLWALIKLAKDRTNAFLLLKKLARRRTADTTDFVSSYRHLREHGNAFLIVLYELIFALLIHTILSHPNENSSANIWLVFMLGLVWIFPAAIVWLVGTSLERQFVDHG